LSVPEPPFAVPARPTIPLTVEIRRAYQDLYDKMQDTIDQTTNVALLEALNTWQGEVDDILTKDNMYRLKASSALFDALLKQINDTNDGLDKLKNQIQSISAGFEEAGQVLAAIDKVLTLIPGI
jgi:predicted nuclease with TOPRIM domain